MFSTDLMDLRGYFFTTWRKYQAQEALEPLEQQLLSLILMHPEYHSILAQPERYLDYDFSQSPTHPFLHLALHQGILEQISTDKPAGIRKIYQTLKKQLGDAHEAEHCIMECLATFIWEALRAQKDFDSAAYLNELKRRLKQI